MRLNRPRSVEQLGYDSWAFKGDAADAGTTYVRDVHFASRFTAVLIFLFFLFVSLASTAASVAQVASTDRDRVEETTEQHGQHVRRGRRDDTRTKPVGSL